MARHKKVRAQADDSFKAKSMLEAQYGKGSVLHGLTKVSN